MSAENKAGGAMMFAVTIGCDVKKDIGNIAKAAQSAIKGSFGKLGKGIESSVAKPAEAAKSVQKSMDGIKKGMQSVAGSSDKALEAPVENAKLKVQELEDELRKVGGAIDSKWQKKQSELAPFYGKDEAGLADATNSALSKDKEYQKLLQNEEKLNSRLLAAQNKLNLQKQLSAQKAEQKQTAEREKSAAKAQALMDKERTAAEKAEQKQVQATQKAEAKKRLARKKSLKNVGGKLAGGMKNVMSTSAKSVGGFTKKLGKQVGFLGRKIKSAFTRVMITGAILAAMRSAKKMIGELVNQNETLKTSLGQIKGNFQVAFAPIIQSVLPAVTALMQGLALLTKKMAEFTSAFYGKTYQQSVAAVKGLKKTQKEAKKAGSLAGIDEINNIGKSDEKDSGTDMSALDKGYADGNKVVQNIREQMTRIAQEIPNFIAASMKKLASAAPGFVSVASDVVNAFLGSLNGRWGEISQSGIKILTSLLDGLISVSPNLGTAAANVVSTLLEAILVGAPKLLEAGAKFLTSFLSGISQKIPELVPKMKECVQKMLTTLKEHLPKILQIGMDILFELIRGISAALPDLVPQVIDVAVTIIGTLLNNLPELIKTGGKLLEGVVWGIANAIPTLLNGVDDVIRSCIDKFKETDWLAVGKNIMRSIWEGIKSGWNSVKDFFSGDNMKAVVTGGDVKLPSFASGGIVSKPTLAMVGDNRRSPEAITPLHELYALIKGAVADGNNNGGNNNPQPMNITLQVGGKKLLTWVTGDEFGTLRGGKKMTA